MVATPHSNEHYFYDRKYLLGVLDELQEIANWLMGEKAVHFLSTDAHETKRPVPVLSAGRNVVLKEFGEKVARTLVEDNPCALITCRCIQPLGIKTFYRAGSAEIGEEVEGELEGGAEPTGIELICGIEGD